jgi:hypothetical protein
MVCEVTADTLLYGTIYPLYRLCYNGDRTCLYRMNEPDEHRRVNSIQRRLKTSVRLCPCLKERDGVIYSRLHVPLPCDPTMLPRNLIQRIPVPEKLADISGDLHLK